MNKLRLVYGSDDLKETKIKLEGGWYEKRKSREPIVRARQIEGS
jgi:hypothetical protein